MQNVVELAKKKGVTPGQLALAWVTARGDDVIPIPGTKRISCVDENVAAVNVKLTAEECKELEDAVPHHEVRALFVSDAEAHDPCSSCANQNKRDKAIHEGSTSSEKVCKSNASLLNIPDNFWSGAQKVQLI